MTRFDRFAHGPTHRKVAEAIERANAEPPEEWHRPEGYTGICPSCGSAKCDGYYRPDHDHLLAFDG